MNTVRTEKTLRAVSAGSRPVPPPSPLPHRCRCCGARIDPPPMLAWSGLPGRAQEFPGEAELAEDRGIDLEIYQCPFCGLIQAAGEPVPYCRDVMRSVGLSPEMRTFRVEYFRAFLSRFHLEYSRIVEIGAGRGEYMELMGQAMERAVQAIGTTGQEPRHGSVTGLEHRAASVEEARAGGLAVREGFVEGEDYSIPGAPYDAFYTMSFLEHIPEPGGFLRGIARNLREDAVGLVEVPNTDFILEQRLFSEFMLDHLSYFTRNTLRLVLEQNGFEMLDCQAVWHDYILAAAVRKRRAMDSGPLRTRQEKLVTDIRRYVDGIRAAGGRVAVWGAGHEALALLAMADLSGKVEFVVDSAPFKQDRYTPATHIPVSAPHRLGRGEADAVLVMAGSYSGEVARILNRSWPDLSAAVVEADRVRLL